MLDALTSTMIQGPLLIAGLAFAIGLAITLFTSTR
jgi:hypothetical protein